MTYQKRRQVGGGPGWWPEQLLLPEGRFRPEATAPSSGSCFCAPLAGFRCARVERAVRAVRADEQEDVGRPALGSALAGFRRKHLRRAHHAAAQVARL